jgi:catechol 2,3-dioxygenase-like lactoylglutathione lyase family enzyme
VSPRLGIVGIMVEDMARSLSFYRKPGLEAQEGTEEQGHVEVEIGGGVVVFWDAVFAETYDPDRVKPGDGYRILPEFFVGGREALDAVYEELEAGAHGYGAPFETHFGA